MPDAKPPVALVAAEAPARAKASNDPEPFATQMLKRQKRPLGDLFGLIHFGVNLTRIAPAGRRRCATRTKQDEFVYILEGRRREELADAEDAYRRIYGNATHLQRAN